MRSHSLPQLGRDVIKRLAFPSLIGSGCDPGLCECSQGALHSSRIGSGCDQGLCKCSQGALFPSLIGSGCDQGLCKCSQGALRYPS